VLAAVASTALAQASWLTYGFNSQRTGYNGSERTIGAANAAGLHKLWSRGLGDVMIAQPTEAAGVNVAGVPTNVVYEGTEHGDLWALKADTGAVIWRKNFRSVSTSCSDMPDSVYGIGGAGAISFSSPGVGVIFIAGGDGSVHALDLATGNEQTGWPVKGVFTPTREHVYSGINLVGAKLYVTVASYCDFSPYFGDVVEIARGTHAVINRFYPAGPPSGGVSGGGIWGPGGVSVDPTNGDVFAATGNALTSPENYKYSNAVVELSASLALLGHTSPSLTGYDVDFGATPILFQPAGCPSKLIAAKNKSGVLFVYSEGNLGSGPRQRIQVANVNDSEFNGIPAWDPATNMLYIGNSSDSNAGHYFHGMVAFKAGANCTLSLAWQRTVGPNFASVSPPTVANGVVYYGDGNDGTEYAFDAKSGAPLWNSAATIGGGLYAAPTVINGKLFVGAWDNRLYAFGP
jgi:outer membrane protein assembly factor BamB